MKTILTVAFFIVNLALQAQSEKVSGHYEFELDATNAYFLYKIQLNNDGTFLFHSYKNIENNIPAEDHYYGKGTWELKKKIIYFHTQKTSFDEKHTLDFNNSKARFITKSPRDKSNREIKTSIRFYESDIPWIQGRTFLKK